jgi:hypothetical protein
MRCVTSCNPRLSPDVCWDLILPSMKAYRVLSANGKIFQNRDVDVNEAFESEADKRMVELDQNASIAPTSAPTAVRSTPPAARTGPPAPVPDTTGPPAPVPDTTGPPVPVPDTGEALTTEATKRYRQTAGELMYLASMSKPDLSYAAGYLARQLQVPTKSNEVHLKLREGHFTIPTRHLRPRSHSWPARPFNSYQRLC